MQWKVQAHVPSHFECTQALLLSPFPGRGGEPAHTQNGRGDAGLYLPLHCQEKLSRSIGSSFLLQCTKQLAPCARLCFIRLRATVGSTVGPVTGAVKVEEGALDCKDAEGEHSSGNDSFPMRQQMARHRQKKYQCRFCPFSSSYPSDVKGHERTHTGEKPFSCRFCYRVFALKSNLHVHERIHTGEKPFRCQTCQKAFTRSSDLVRHRRVHTGNKPYGCGTCGAAFQRRFQLRCHEGLHGGDLPFHCKQCGALFVQISHLNAHQKEHHP
ncbi:hypothetical protein ISCGN_025666 [Ixodes scapularis]